MRKSMVVVGVCAAAMGMGAWAMATGVQGAARDSVKEQVGQLIDAGGPASAAEKAEAKFEARLAAQTKRESSLDVGDADSFGRQVRWLGFASGKLLVLRDDCTPQPGEDPDMLCMQLNPGTGTQFGEFRDVAHMTLPARSTNSLLCHWLTPTIGATLANYSGVDNRLSRLSMQPSITFENEVLNAPGLVDPDTGAPLNGKLDVFASSSQLLGLLDNGEQVPQRLNATRTCIGGYLNKKSLVEFYGLSATQAKEFFNKPTTVRLNMNVFASNVSYANVSYAVRFVGD